MKKYVVMLLAALSLIGCEQKEEIVNARWVSFNIRNDDPNDGENNWKYRKERVAQFIKDYQIDVIGAQEVLHNQFLEMEQLLPGYKGVGVAGTDGKTEGGYCAVFYNTNKFDALDSGTFWLAEKPDSIGMIGWDADCVRICTWAKLKEKKTGKIVMTLNTHLDHVGKESRNQSALLIISKIKEIVGDQPAIVTGDFNVTDQSDCYATITTNEFVLKDAHKIAEKVTGVTPNVEVLLYTDTAYIDPGKVTVKSVRDISDWNAAILDVRAVSFENKYRFEIDVACYGKNAVM